MGAIDDSTPVVTTIHDCQLLAEDIPAEKMLEHDVPVDIIVTPTQVMLSIVVSQQAHATAAAVDTGWGGLIAGLHCSKQHR